MFRLEASEKQGKDKERPQDRSFRKDEITLKRCDDILLWFWETFDIEGLHEIVRVLSLQVLLNARKGC